MVVVDKAGDAVRCSFWGESPFWMSDWDVAGGKPIGFVERVVAAATTDQPRNVLILGLGGGSMVGEIARTHPGLSTVSVEIDPGMIATAKAHFYPHFPPSAMDPEQHRIVCQDALRFDTAERFDCILGDTPHFYEMERGVDEMISRCIALSAPDRTAVWIFNSLTERNARRLKRVLVNACGNDRLDGAPSIWFEAGNWFVSARFMA